MQTEDRRFCRRCLLKDMDKDAYFKNIYEYIAALDPSVRTPDEEYEARLQECRQCDSLINGMCRLCGCFVEVRAAKVNAHCPGIPRRWG